MTQAPATPAAATRAQVLRKQRFRRLVRLFAVVVGVPTLAAIVYYCFLVQPQYRSLAIFRVVDVGVGVEQADDDLDPRALARELIQSRTMAAHLAGAGLLQHYVEAGDHWSALSADAGPETQYQYFRDMVAVKGPSKTGALTLEVVAFSGQDAQRLAGHIFEHAQAMWTARFQERLERRAAAAEKLAEVERQRAAEARAALRALDEAGADPASDAHAEAKVAHGAAQQAYEQARLAAEKARLVRDAGATRQLELVEGPTQPAHSVYPRRLWGIATVFFVASALMAVVGLLAGAVREHAKF